VRPVAADATTRRIAAIVASVAGSVGVTPHRKPATSRGSPQSTGRRM